MCLGRVKGVCGAAMGLYLYIASTIFGATRDEHCNCKPFDILSLDCEISSLAFSKSH